MQNDRGTSAASSAGSCNSGCSSATDSEFEQPVHHCSTLESRVTGENVYSRISDAGSCIMGNLLRNFIIDRI